jgi:curli biogenesis system outer membrane secretion channel CsgG
MSLKRLIVVMALAAPAMLGAAQQATAQTQTAPIAQPSQPSPPRYARPRIEINPRPLLYRRCVDWYELQYRPSGTVLYPQMRCWWVRG